MSDVKEDTLDRHFAEQLKLVSDVFIESICTSHHDIIHHWLTVFYNATGSEKYARNCLMVLMHGQLKEMGRLGKPFTDLSNTTRRLDDVLNTYGNDNTSIEKEQPEESKKTVELEAAPASDIESVCSSRCGSSSHYSEKLKATEKSDYELQIQKNRQLLEEVNELHARTIENEQHYKATDSKWQKKLNEGQNVMPLQSKRSMALLLKIEISTRSAIRRLKDWTPSGGVINFLSIALQDILDDEPETRSVLLELDRKLESVLDNLLEQAGERREKNVRILYDKLFQQQQEMLQAKDVLLQKEQAALAEARIQLQAKTRLWDIVTPYYREEAKLSSNMESTPPHQSRKSGGASARRPRLTLSPASSSSTSPVPLSPKRKEINDKNNKCNCEVCLGFKPKFSDMQFHSKC
ncbi:uncharacterized protein LOC117571563 [Drosophila albomicans]|uniref:Uncharacterized protein LOC117571563 n=1 Tax=Drosophila albomicans TaxID=7291 RepID=A0A6P8YWG0_DROAB|nr:uncharacterized protein LOC117571563 [Drosophila albomicans]